MLFRRRVDEIIPGDTSPRVSRTGERLDGTRQRNESAEQRLAGLIRERDKINEAIDSIREEDRKKEEAEWNKKIDAYFKQAYYTGATKLLDRRHDPIANSQKCYIKLLGKGVCHYYTRCLVVYDEGIEIMELPLLQPKAMRLKWIEGMTEDGLRIDDYHPIDKERFYKEFDKTVVNLRRASEQAENEND